MVAIALLAVGTLDDRIGLNIGVRRGGRGYRRRGAVLLGHRLGGVRAKSRTSCSILFVLAVINAFNLMDNLDGATATIALVSAVAIAVFAAVHGYDPGATLAVALAGACAGFLPYNLARPGARIFLGDGGSMAIGVMLAGLFMSLPETEAFGWELLQVIVVLVGLPARHGAGHRLPAAPRRPGPGGGRDHLTHRLFERLGSCRRVALALAGAQAVLSGLAIASSTWTRMPRRRGQPRSSFPAWC